MHPWERRLRDLAQLLANCGTTYFDPERFRQNTNQFLQTSRTVTFIIQKNKATIPNFDTWYKAAILTPWSTDVVMTWAKDSRNVIEKEGDLELHSSIRMVVLFSYLSSEDIVLPDTRAELVGANIKRLLRLANAKLPTGVADAAVLRIERRWVANSLPSRELVNALTYVYARLHDVCISLARHLATKLDDTVPRPTELDPARKDVGHVRFIKLSKPGVTRTAHMRLQPLVDYSPPPALAVLRNEVANVPAPSTLQATVALFARIAQITFEEHNNHVPMLFLFNDEWQQIDFLMAHFSDQADKYIFWRNAAERAAYLRAFALVWVSESWIRRTDKQNDAAIRNLPIVGERLHVVGADLTDARHIVAWNIRREAPDAKPSLAPVPPDDELETGGTVYFLQPVLSAMRAARSGATSAGSQETPSK